MKENKIFAIVNQVFNIYNRRRAETPIEKQFK